MNEENFMVVTPTTKDNFLVHIRCSNGEVSLSLEKSEMRAMISKLDNAIM